MLHAEGTFLGADKCSLRPELKPMKTRGHEGLTTTGRRVTLNYFSQANICFQSFFMLMTVHPFALASSYNA